MGIQIRRLLSGGGLILTYRCTASCAHCLYRSSPQRDPAYMDPELLREMARKAATLGCGSFHIGGGEPFLDVEGLVRIIQVLREEGITIDYLETNAFWYKDPDSARVILEKILEAGCQTLMVSLCPFHIPFVPLYKVEGAVEAARRVGMEYFLWQDQYYRELSSLEKGKTHSWEELANRFGPDYLIQAARRFGLWVNGRALNTLKPYLPSRSAEEIVQEEPSGCQELTRTSHFHLDLYGNYVPPGCVGFSLDYRHLGEDLSQGYPLYCLVVEEGMGGLYEYAKREVGFTSDPGGYVSRCDLCYSLRKALLSTKGGKNGLQVSPDTSLPSKNTNRSRNTYRELGPWEFYGIEG
mgnify:CR=1 FL=1